MAGTGGRRWAVVLMVVDVALLVVFGVLAVDRFQGAPDDDPTSSFVATDEVTDFRMPSGRVACHMDAAGVVCGMNDVKTWPTVEGCPADHVVVLDAAGVLPVCAGTVDVPLPEGSRRTAFGGAYFPTDASVLEYGDSVTVAGSTCESRQAGVLCTNSDGRWFNLRLQDGLTEGGSGDDPPS